ncbi:MAG TPA: hypothetical protein VFG07_07265 [Thermoplasmata archaeon]|nr:hypothetical protein [Thermoplasmata archaeon]
MDEEARRKWFGPPPVPTRAFVEFELEPRTQFGLPDGTTLLQPDGETTPRSRSPEEAIDITFPLKGYQYSLKDNILVVSLTVMGNDLWGAIDLTTEAVRDLEVTAGLGTNVVFKAKYQRAWTEAGGTVGTSEMMTHSFAGWNTTRLASDFREGAEWATAADSALSSALLFYKRAIWVYEAGINAAREERESMVQVQKGFGYAGALAMVLLWKAVVCLTNEHEAQRMEAARRLGLNDVEVQKLEALGETRNRVVHDEWDAKSPDELNNGYGYLRALVRLLLVGRARELSGGREETI